MDNIEQALILKQELDLLRPIKKDDELRIMQKLRLDWNYHSNNLEGNSLTYGETRALILFGITAQGKPLKDHFEITGHDEAVKWVMDIVKKDRPLTENFIRELHKLILKESYEVDAITPEGKPTKRKVNVGVYKMTPNHVKTKTGEIFRFASPEETPALMHDLLEWYRTKLSDENVNPILLAAEFHYRYIRIHPFDDGNGRTARILMNFILMQFSYPPVIIKTDDKENYFSALRQADAGLLKPFMDYIGGNLINSLNIMISGAKGENIEEEDDLLKEITILYGKLENLGDPIKITKGKESILDFYDISVSKVFDEFYGMSKLFEKFYLSSHFYMWMDNGSRGYKFEELIEKSREQITASTREIRFNHKYQHFNKHGAEGFSFDSQLFFNFNFANIRIHDTKNKVIIFKEYGSQLSDEEIRKLVKAEISVHKHIVQQKIDSLSKK